jgi:hypothetical protein
MNNSPYEPEPIDVEAKDGMPATVMVRKKTVKVERILNMWRIDEDWWRQPVSRLYLALELQNGARVTVFQDIISGMWYRQNYGA